jgi:hypothetical protein
LPGLFIPNAVLGLAGDTPAWNPAWVALACALLTVLSLLYIPAAADPLRNWHYSVLTVLARVGGATFFFVLRPGQFPALFGTLDLSFAILQGVLLALAALVGDRPPKDDDPRRTATLWPLVRWVGGIVLVLAAVIGLGVWYFLFREEPQTFDSDEEAFKYASIGTEEEGGIPYWIWLVLPRVFPEHLPGPGGYTSLGIVWEQGHEMPVGFTKRTIGFPRVGINCALCHSGTYRLRAQDVPKVVPTAPATRLDPLGYQRFLFACASDPRFTPDVLLAAIGYEVKLSWLEEKLYRYALIPQTRKAILKEKDRYAWTHERPYWGRGRIDPFNPVKYRILGISPDEDRTVGNSDMMPLWNRRAREGHSLHWDGLNTSLTEVIDSGAIGDGATPKSLPVAHLRRMETWLMDVKPPKYPLKVDNALAAQGKAVFDRTCAACHAPGGEWTGKIIPRDRIGTDDNRLAMWTEQARDNYNRYAAGHPFAFKSFVKQDGYLAVPLDGLWLRGPYLHNGSVPTVDDLLRPVAQRPTEFYRGYDVLDRERLGFVTGDEARRAGAFRFETKVQGNANRGHEGKVKLGEKEYDYGTDLPADQKRALIEYLKTL